jgi:arsenite methyltransferase
MAGSLNDRWLVRRFRPVLGSARFRIERFDSPGYLQTPAPDYMLTLVDRRADLLAGWERIDAHLADDLSNEARRRVDDGSFFGFLGLRQPRRRQARRTDA